MASGAKKVLAVLGIILLIAAVAVTLNTYFKQNESRAQLREVSIAASKLNSQKKFLEDELEDMQEEYRNTVNSDMCITLFFDNLTNNLVDEVYPLLRQYGYKGTIVMRDLLIPGDEECISRENFKMIINRGWDAAIGGSCEIDMEGEDAPELLGAYLDEYIEKLKLSRLTVPTTYCFDEGEYDPKFDQVLADRGFNVVRYSSNEEYPSIPSGGISFINSKRLCAAATAVQSDVEAAYELKETLGVHVRYIDLVYDENIDCTEQKYTNMLTYFKDKCPEAQVLTASELYTYKETALRENEEYITNYSGREAEIKKELEDIETKLDELYEKIE